MSGKPLRVITPPPAEALSDGLNSRMFSSNATIPVTKPIFESAFTLSFIETLLPKAIELFGIVNSALPVANAFIENIVEIIVRTIGNVSILKIFFSFI